MKKRNNSKKKKKTTSKVGGRSSNLTFEKNAGIITDNEYEIASEMNCNSNRKNNNKKRCK